MGIASSAGNIFFVYQFIKRLETPFENTDAYKLGIIDEKGKVLRKRSTLKTKEEKSSNLYRMILFFIGFVAIVIGEISVRYASPDLKSNLKFFITPLLLFFIFNYFFNKKSKEN